MEGRVPPRPLGSGQLSCGNQNPNGRDGTRPSKTRRHHRVIRQGTGLWRAEFHLGQRRCLRYKWPGWYPALQNPPPIPRHPAGHGLMEGRVPSRPAELHEAKWPGWYPALQNPPPIPSHPAGHGLVEGRVPSRPAALPATQVAGVVPGPPEPGALLTFPVAPATAACRRW